ncbi:MAG: hypothetical protein KAQ87_04865 [Candidatus Pacebacteria bacterium]|nr:hypothetical protein [Candidatus Paceibacterota bacterium]
MKSFIIIILLIAGLLGAILVMNYPKENSTEINTQNTIENVVTEKIEDEHEHEHDHSVEIEGSEMKRLTIQEVANLWEIDSEELLGEIIQKFNLKKNYTTETTLEYIRDEEYKFSPAIIKDIAEKLKDKK